LFGGQNKKEKKMKKIDGTRWRKTKVTKRELANVLLILDRRGDLSFNEQTAKAIETLPAPTRNAGNPLRDPKYLDNVVGEPALHMSDRNTKVVLLLLDAGEKTKCSIVYWDYRGGQEGQVAIRATWRAAHAQNERVLEEILSELDPARPPQQATSAKH